jgi:branched-chain amino acid transport system substrate-binding protein
MSPPVFVRLALVIAVVTSTLAPASESAAQGGAIKIGMLAPLTGAFSGAGKDMLAGLELYFDEINRQIAGRRIELVVEDTEGNPQQALSKARKLVEQDKVHLLTGGLLAPTGYALHPFVESARIPTTFPLIASDDLTQRKAAKWIVRTGATASQPMHAFGDWTVKSTKYRRIVALSLDHAYSWEALGGFQRTFEEQGGQIVQKIWVPFTTNDFAPYLAQIRRDADAVLLTLGGRYSIQFAKQWQSSGLAERMPVLAGGVTVDETVLTQLGDEANGWVSTLYYSAALDTPANRRFVKAFEAKTGKTASYFSETCYTGARWIADAIKAVDGKVEDRDTLLAALRRVDIKESPRGPISVDNLNNPVENVYVRRVERVGGKLQNTVIATIPAVGQFWKYNPEEYLKQPLYTRNHPACKFC